MFALPQLCLIGAFLLLTYGSWKDYQTLRIPYVTILGVAGFGLVFLYVQGQGVLVPVVTSLVFCLVLLVTSEMLELKRGVPALGYGDIQLMTACVLWVQPEDLSLFFICTGAAGLLLAFFKKKQHFPLAPAIAFGWIVSLFG